MENFVLTSIFMAAAGRRSNILLTHLSKTPLPSFTIQEVITLLCETFPFPSLLTPSYLQSIQSVRLMFIDHCSDNAGVRCEAPQPARSRPPGGTGLGCSDPWRWLLCAVVWCVVVFYGVGGGPVWWTGVTDEYSAGGFIGRERQMFVWTAAVSGPPNKTVIRIQTLTKACRTVFVISSLRDGCSSFFTLKEMIDSSKQIFKVRKRLWLKDFVMSICEVVVEYISNEIVII